MIDFHCHVLCGIDDGARGAQESQEILAELKRQGITQVAATPHFVAEYMKTDEFIKLRQEALLKIENTFGIDIMLGAEVLLVPELLDIEDIERLCIGGSNVMLLEMPFSPWQRWMFDFIKKIRRKGIIPVFAHVERYFEGGTFKYKKLFENEQEVYMQFNADAFLSWSGRGIVKKLLSIEGVRPVLGSDTHNLTGRRPYIDKAQRIILKKFDGLFGKMEYNAAFLLSGKG